MKIGVISQWWDEEEEIGWHEGKIEEGVDMGGLEGPSKRSSDLVSFSLGVPTKFEIEHSLIKNLDTACSSDN